MFGGETAISVNERLIQALSPIAPVYPWIELEGNRDARQSRYFVFNYSTFPDTFADDLPCYEKYLIQVHYFCPIADSTVNIRRWIKRALFEADFTWPDETAVRKQNQTGDSGGQHYCFECETLEVIFDGETGDG